MILENSSENKPSLRNESWILPSQILFGWVLTFEIFFLFGTHLLLIAYVRTYVGIADEIRFFYLLIPIGILFFMGIFSDLKLIKKIWDILEKNQIIIHAIICIINYILLFIITVGDLSAITTIGGLFFPLWLCLFCVLLLLQNLQKPQMLLLFSRKDTGLTKDGYMIIILVLGLIFIMMIPIIQVFSLFFVISTLIHGLGIFICMVSSSKNNKSTEILTEIKKQTNIQKTIVIFARVFRFFSLLLIMAICFNFSGIYFTPDPVAHQGLFYLNYIYSSPWFIIGFILSLAYAVRYSSIEGEKTHLIDGILIGGTLIVISGTYELAPFIIGLVIVQLLVFLNNRNLRIRPFVYILLLVIFVGSYYLFYSAASFQTGTDYTFILNIVLWVFVGCSICDILFSMLLLKIYQNLNSKIAIPQQTRNLQEEENK